MCFVVCPQLPYKSVSYCNSCLCNWSTATTAVPTKNGKCKYGTYSQVDSCGSHNKVFVKDVLLRSSVSKN